MSIIGLMVEHKRIQLEHNRASFWELLKSIIEQFWSIIRQGLPGV